MKHVLVYTKGENYQNREIERMKTNSYGSIAIHQMKLQTRRAQTMKAHDHIYKLQAQQLIPAQQSKAENDQQSPAHT